MSNPTLPEYSKPMPRGGKVIRYARELRGFSQADYAHTYGVTKNTLGNWERGISEPGFFTVVTILNDLKVDLVEAYKNAK